VAALLVALTVGATVFFRVETVAVSGNSRYTEEDVVSASGIELGDNLYGLNKVKVSEQLRQQLPYVGEVTIRRALPSTIVIAVTEWDAVAQIAVPTAQQAAAAQAELSEEGKEGASGQPDPTPVAQEPWLISVKGKLLEPAPAGSSAIVVTGATPLMPQAGTQLSVPRSEQSKLDALLSLLAAMEEAGMIEDFSAIDLGSTQIVMRYLDRFDVKIEINADFRYDLQVIAKVRQDIEEKHGPSAAGGMDLTQEGYELIYSPA